MLHLDLLKVVTVTMIENLLSELFTQNIITTMGDNYSLFYSISFVTCLFFLFLVGSACVFMFFRWIVGLFR